MLTDSSSPSSRSLLPLHENLLKNPLWIFENDPSTSSSSSLSLTATYPPGIKNQFPLHLNEEEEEEQQTSDEDQSEDNEDGMISVSMPEVLCNLKDIEVPIDNDILFEVDENDSIRISSPGTCVELKPGDILVSVNGRFIKSYSEGQEILHEEMNTLHAKQILKLRILIGKTSEEIAMESRAQEELLRYKNALYYATNFYSLAQDTHQKHHYNMSLQYLHKAYQLASSSSLTSKSSSLSSSPSLPLIKRLFKLMACCRELQGINYLSLGQDIHAIEYFQEAIKLRQQIYENEFHLSIYKSIDTLSRIYRRHSIFSQSLFYAQLLIDICHQNQMQHSSQMANALSNLAKVKKSQLLLNDSFLLEIESFQLRVMIFGYHHESIGMSLLAIGRIKQSLGDLGNGTEEIYQKAVNIYQKLIQSTSTSANCNADSPPKRLPPLTSVSSMNSLHNHLGDVYSSLSSLERERKNLLQAEQYKLQEISSRQHSKHLSRALLEAYWEFNELIESVSLITNQDRSHEASDYRLKAINGMKRMYGEKNKRMMKMMKEHGKKSKNSVVSKEQQGEGEVEQKK